MNSFNFQIVQIDTISSIQIPFPEHICYFTEDTDKYYICKDNALKEIFVDTTSLTWSNITNKPTTITGYGITDAVKSNNGTVNYVAKFTPDGTTIGNSQIIDDGTNITVGSTTDVDSLVTVNTQTLSNALFSSSKKTTGTNRGLYGEAIGNGASFNFGLHSYATGANLNIGVNTRALGTGTVIGIKAEAQGTGTKYSIQLQDGTEAAGKFLKSVTADGKANWANITPSDIQGSIGTVTSVGITLGTSGDDINISNSPITSSGSINLNVPTASATARGLLSSSDWTTFNDKIGGIGQASFVPRFFDSKTIYSGVIQDDGTNVGIRFAPNPIAALFVNGLNNTHAIYASSTTSGNGKTVIHGSGQGDGPGENIGVMGSAYNAQGSCTAVNGYADGNNTSTGSIIGGHFKATKSLNNSKNYSVQLEDGSEGIGKFLKSFTLDGKANWANITTADIQGYQASSFSISESKVIFVDATYGNDTTGEKYNPAKPYLTWTAAIAVAVSGDWIVFNAGTYSVSMAPVNNVNVFCKPGVIFTSGFRVSSSITWRLHGYAEFNATVPLYINSSGATHDIYFEFDRTSGLVGTGLECLDLTATMLKLTFNCNYLTASRPLVFDNNATGATYDVVVNVSQKILGYGDKTIFLPSSFTAGNLYGSIVINANVIEHTSSATYRQVLWMGPSNTNNFEMHINAKLIKATSTTFNDLGDSNFSAVLVFFAGDNVNINANIDAGEIPCIINHSNGGTYAVGNMTITGNLYSKREIVQQYSKLANGNGWHDVTIKNGFIHSKGLGLSDSMFHRQNNWSYGIGGIPGNTRLVNCVIYNANTNASATATIVKDDAPDVGKNNNFQLYNCLAFVETAGFLATSVQATKYISAHNVRTNRALGSTVLDGFSPSGVIVDANLTIPKTNINV